MTDCKKSWFRRCRFEARYEDAGPRKDLSVEQIDALSSGIMFSDTLAQAIDDMTRSPKRYVHDVCIRCGKIAAQSQG